MILEVGFDGEQKTNNKTTADWLNELHVTWSEPVLVKSNSPHAKNIGAGIYRLVTIDLGKFQTMSRTYDFIVNLSTSVSPPPAKLLDFGCGAGQVVTKALAAGYDAYGTDLFEGGWNQLKESATALGDRLHLMPSPVKLPFDDSTFDIVISNQVFEHVKDKGPIIAELSRVLRPGGKLIAIFPTRDVLIEPHLKAPLIHWFENGSRIQKFVLELSHRLGMASASPSSRDAWIANAIHSLESDMFYISDRTVPSVFGSAFTITHRAEAEWIRDRVSISKTLKPLSNVANNPFVNLFLRQACLRLANGVYIFSRGAAALSQNTSRTVRSSNL
jgi:SAM-dependent methyltransferase